MPELRQSEPAGRTPAASSIRPRDRLPSGADLADAYGLVLLLVMSTVVLSSLLPGDGWWAVVTVTSCSMTALVALRTASAPASRVRKAVVALGATTALAVLSALLDNDATMGVAFSGAVMLLAVAMATVLINVVSARSVDSRTLLGAVSVYTSLGLLFTFAYRAIDRFQPGEFFEGSLGSGGGDYVFFSYTTLTTTGYGNLVPADQPGKLFALVEMLTGQIFLVTLVAGLVTLWRPRGHRNEP